MSWSLTQITIAVRLAKLKADRVFEAPCDTSVLYPTTGGNIHAFTAKTPCAVLDVLGPPYSKDDGRDCSYYKDHPYTASSEWNSYSLLTSTAWTTLSYLCVKSILLWMFPLIIVVMLKWFILWVGHWALPELLTVFRLNTNLVKDASIQFLEGPIKNLSLGYERGRRVILSYTLGGFIHTPMYLDIYVQLYILLYQNMVKLTLSRPTNSSTPCSSASLTGTGEWWCLLKAWN